MKASVFYAAKDIRYTEDYPEKPLKAGQVKIKIKWCGICGSDLHEYMHGPMSIPSEPHPVTGKMFPLIMGHEFSGEIVEVAPDVTDYKIGDRVTANPFISCGHCHMCLNNRPLSCVTVALYGLMEDGAFAEYLNIEADHLIRLPDNLTYEEGALIEPLAVTVHALHESEVKVGQTVLVTGAGPIGLCAVLNAKANGCTVICSEVATARKQAAADCGADYIIDPSQEDLVEKVKEITNGIGADVALDCAGAPATVLGAIHSIKNGGRVVCVGIPSKPFEFDIKDILYSEKQIHAIHGYHGYYSEFNEAVNLIAMGKVDPSPLITGKIALKDIVDEGYEKLINDKDNQLKIIVSPELD